MLNAYYFRHHMVSLVPRHVREDMKWMADIGTEMVSLAILEQDFEAARRNVDIICAQAQRVGMKTGAVPSRWAGLVAGSPKVPSQFAAAHPPTWAQNRDGSPQISEFSGPQSSVFHRQTREFFFEATQRLFQQWPFSSVTWDEPKCLNRVDFSPAARARLGEVPDKTAYLQGVAQFFNDAGIAARQVRPDVSISLFLMANAKPLTVEIFSAIATLDYFGCDGRPWHQNDGGQLEAPRKTLLDQAPRFLQAARANNKGGLILIENHNMPWADIERMDKRLPEVLDLGAQQVIYYYFPRNLEDPERAMGVLARHLSARQS